MCRLVNRVCDVILSTASLALSCFFYNEVLKGAEFSKTKVVCFCSVCNLQHHKHAQFCILNSGYFCPISTRREFGGRYVLAQIPHIKFHENSPSGNPFVLCGRADGQRALKSLTVAFRKFVKAPAQNYAHAAPAEQRRQ